MVVNPSRIQMLSPLVANQIAAGEVIERPASIVKELLENAMDAHASTITIEIDYGGMHRIKISDNGVGIMAEDLMLAVSAHATSKLSNLEDLYKIRSMGFRGEALASIAAVSKFTLTSKPAMQDHAMMISNEKGIFLLEACARTNGTTVEVKDIFYNVPVRKSFLKNASSEFQAIEMIVKRFALAQPDIEITLLHNDKKIIALPIASNELNKISRIQKIFGKKFFDEALILENNYQNLHLYGWMSHINYQISQNDKLWVYINQRMVKDKLISHAIKQAYEPYLHPGRYPVVLLYISLPPNELDVNIHPTKHEVRFKDPRLVHDFILTQLKEVLQRAERKEVHLLEKTPAYRPSIPLQDSIETHEKNWIVLNDQFALMFLNEVPYIVNVKKIEEERLYEFLQKQSTPLPSRLLLVPVQFTVDKNKIVILEKFQQTLTNYGIQFNWLSEHTIVIRSIPTMLPQLHIQAFFQALMNTAVEDLLKLLLTHSVELLQMTVEDKISLKNYLVSKKTLSREDAFCLDANHCHKLLSPYRHSERIEESRPPLSHYEI